MELNEEQKVLVEKLKDFVTRKYKPFFYYAGRAGTGKTTVIRALLEEMNIESNEYITAAFVGKAVMVLIRKGYSAITLHSLMYDPVAEIIHDVVMDEYGNMKKIRKKIFRFELKKELSPDLKLIIVDEAMMVPDKMIMELLSFGIPVIFMGDINQLPPVHGVNTILNEPDFILNQIMRQEEDDPIVQLANHILSGNDFEYGTYGQSKVVDNVPFDKDLLTDYDVIICGKNRTRDMLNHAIRNKLLNYKADKINRGEKLICRQNNWDECIEGIYLTNGTVGFVEDIHKDKSSKSKMVIDFRPDFMPKGTCFEDIELDRKYFYTPIQYRQNYGVTRFLKFEFGYVLTTHLVQGSEYNRVLFIDEPFYDPSMTRKLRYTAITRAIESITIVKGKGVTYE